MKLTRTSLLNYLGWNTQGDLGPWTFYTTKKHNTVFFLKAPPTTPPTYLQIQQRLKFKLIAAWWQQHSDTEKALWEFATQKLKLNLTGYDLFTWYYLTFDRTTLATIQRLANVTLIED